MVRLPLRVMPKSVTTQQQGSKLMSITHIILEYMGTSSEDHVDVHGLCIAGLPSLDAVSSGELVPSLASRQLNWGEQTLCLAQAAQLNWSWQQGCE